MAVPVLPARTQTRREAWIAVGAVTLLLWLVIGVGCFGVGAGLVAARFGPTLPGAFVLDLVFLVGVLIVIGAVVGWQRSRGETIRDLGWRRPTRPVAIVVGILFGLLWTATGYARGGNPLAWSWERPVMALIGIVLAFGEELAVRGFLMEQLHRARVPAWVQVVVSAVVMGVYHGVLGAHYSPLYAASSVVLFGIVSLIFLLGRRSLTPGLTAHAMTHVLGDPGLIQGILFGVIVLNA